MSKLSFSLEIVLLGILLGIAILTPRYDSIVRKNIVIGYNFNESFCLYLRWFRNKTVQIYSNLDIRRFGCKTIG